MSTLLTKLAWLLVPCGLVAAGGGYWITRRAASDEVPAYRTATVERKDVVVSISASGTIEPEEIVDVGAQVAGKITAFGVETGSEKTIDYGSPVEPGTVLARIDDDLYQEEVELAKADLAQAKSQRAQAQTGVHQAAADLQRAEADLRQQESRLRQAERDHRRIADLRTGDAASQQELDTAASRRRVRRDDRGGLGFRRRPTAENRIHPRAFRRERRRSGRRRLETRNGNHRRRVARVEIATQESVRSVAHPRSRTIGEAP